MKVRRFSARTMPEALRQVKAALGSEAVLLDTQAAADGVTITAAVDDDDVHAVPPGEELCREVRELIAAVRSLVPPAADDAAPGAATALANTGAGAARDAEGAFPAAAAPLARALAREGVDPAVAGALVRAASARLADVGSLDGAVAAELAALSAPEAAARVRLFLGPPGDGKTTTLVKLAARERAAGRRVVLVQADGFRIGGAAELAAYGRVLGIRVVRATEPGALAAVVASADEHDRVLVDTPGAGPGQKDELAELARLAAEAGAAADRLLVVSAGAGAGAAAAAMRALAPLAPHASVLTKCDAAAGAPWLGVLWQREVRVAYLATGRRIPDDLEPATSARLARCLLAR